MMSLSMVNGTIAIGCPANVACSQVRTGALACGRTDIHGLGFLENLKRLDGEITAVADDLSPTAVQLPTARDAGSTVDKRARPSSSQCASAPPIVDADVSSEGGRGSRRPFCRKRLGLLQ